MPKVCIAKSRVTVSPKGFDSITYTKGMEIPEAIYKKYEGIDAFDSKVDYKTVRKAKAEEEPASD